VDWTYESDTNKILNNLKNSGYRIVGVEQVENSTKLSSFKPNHPTALIFGHEVDGISKEVINSCDEFLEIVQYGTKHSLNISVCAGIVIYKASQSLK
jgi:tRNA G18 (ribose-2'-O)-methylase SpoU